MAKKKPTKRTTPKVFGYARVSTKHQRLDRQVLNIATAYPGAEIVTEMYSGTTLDRPAWNELYNELIAGDVLIFDEVSRMSRDADEGAAIYEELYTRGVTLVFLKQPLVNTDNYRQAATASIAKTGEEIADIYIEATNKVLLILARRQVKQAFEQAQAEVDHLHKRVAEGMRASGAPAKIAKARTGNTYETRRSKEAKVRIRQMSRTFDGIMPDKDVIDVLHLARNSYYKYKKEILEEMAENAQEPTGNSDPDELTTLQADH